jgi:glycine dehydrogenase subunit 1
LRETAELCAAKAQYAADKLTRIPGVRLAIERPFFKEFTIRVPGDVCQIVAWLIKDRYLAGPWLGQYYQEFGDSIAVAVTEKRTKSEIDGLAAALATRVTDYGAIRHPVWQA